MAMSLIRTQLGEYHFPIAQMGEGRLGWPHRLAFGHTAGKSPGLRLQNPARPRALPQTAQPQATHRLGKESLSFPALAAGVRHHSQVPGSEAVTSGPVHGLTVMSFGLSPQGKPQLQTDKVSRSSLSLTDKTVTY